MRNIIISAISSMMMLFVGCQTLPTTEKMATYSRSIGYAAGLAVNIGKVDDATKGATLAILNQIKLVVPSENQTFIDVWTPFVNDIVNKNVSAGKLTNEQANLAKSVMIAAENGLDYMFNVRWPNAKQYSELMTIGIDNFVDGFKSIINPVMSTAAQNIDFEEYSRALEYLSKQ